jgi:hypothetical protein
MLPEAPGFVFHHHRLAQRARQRLDDQARGEISGATGRSGHDQRDGTLRVFALGEGRRAGKQGRAAEGQQAGQGG